MSDDWFRYAAATFILAFFAFALVSLLLAYLVDLVKRWFK